MSFEAMPHEVAFIAQYLLFFGKLHHCIYKLKSRGTLQYCSSHTAFSSCEIIENNKLVCLVT